MQHPLLKRLILGLAISASAPCLAAENQVISANAPRANASGQEQAARAALTSAIRRWQVGTNPAKATLHIHADERAAHPIPRYITGKFAEHLGANIYNGMDAQILRNPTLADYPFGNGQMTPDGITKFQCDDDKIVAELRRQASRTGWPESELKQLIAARADGLACFWARSGPRGAVEVSPDTGPYGGRGQRIQARQAGLGISQWTWLPLHRVRHYEFEILARSPDVSGLTVLLGQAGSESPVASVQVAGLSRQWQKLKGRIEVPAEAPADSAYRFVVTAQSPGQVVIAHIFLWPGDHVQGADPDVVRLLRQAHLPLLRWPGGNFVSGYHWEDGIGPIEQRPTRPNFAWGGVEPNLFGTDEFMSFCRSVGCEPMICLNAGSGTPAEAARWVEYCNGPVTSPMGARRSANGHPEPYNVRHWEIGNELWGRWQYHWTTASGYVDRFNEFVPALQTADSNLKLYACGAPVFWGKEWNDALIGGTASSLETITDHPLIGGQVSSAVEPLAVYRDFMVVPDLLEQKWAGLRDDMARAGIRQPHLAVTELQLFAHLDPRSDSSTPVRLTHENLVQPATQAEALYDILIYHAAVRLEPFVTMVTHSAVINHGGGLRKERERVYANPCYYAQAAFAAFGGATPVRIDLEAARENAPRVLSDVKNAGSSITFSAVDALAARATDGSLLVSVVHRGSTGPIRLTIELDQFKPASQASLWMLSAERPWAANTLSQPAKVKPAEWQVATSGQEIEVELPPYTVLRARIPSSD